MILRVADYNLITLSQSNLLKLDIVQNEDTTIETMHYLLDLPSMETKHTVEQVKAYLNMQNPKNPLHQAVKKEKKRKKKKKEKEKGCRLARDKTWMDQADQSSSMCAASQSSSK